MVTNLSYRHIRSFFDLRNPEYPKQPAIGQIPYFMGSFILGKYAF